MIKYFYLLLSASLFFNANKAAAKPLDSVAVFYTEQKTAVLINERGTFGRLQQFMNALGLAEDIYWLNEDESIKIHCGRDNDKASCVFRFLPSKSVSVEAKTVSAETMATDLNKSDFEMEFESSQNDRFILKMNSQLIKFWAGKKGTQPPESF